MNLFVVAMRVTVSFANTFFSVILFKSIYVHILGRRKSLLIFVNETLNFPESAWSINYFKNSQNLYPARHSITADLQNCTLVEQYHKIVCYSVHGYFFILFFFKFYILVAVSPPFFSPDPPSPPIPSPIYSSEEVRPPLSETTKSGIQS